MPVNISSKMEAFIFSNSIYSKYMLEHLTSYTRSVLSRYQLTNRHASNKGYSNKYKRNILKLYNLMHETDIKV